MRPRVLIHLITGTERHLWINPELALSLFHMAQDRRFENVVVVSSKDGVPEVARNEAIILARDNGYDWLVSLTNDSFMRRGTPLDIVVASGGRYPVIGLTHGVNMPHAGGYQLFPPSADDARKMGDGFDEVSAVQGGVLILNKDVWKKLPTGPWFHRAQHMNAETLAGDRAPDGGLGLFCDLMKQHGLKIWTHREVLAGSYRTIDLTSMCYTLAQSQPGPKDITKELLQKGPALMPAMDRVVGNPWERTR